MTWFCNSPEEMGLSSLLCPKSKLKNKTLHPAMATVCSMHWGTCLHDDVTGKWVCLHAVLMAVQHVGIIRMCGSFAARSLWQVSTGSQNSALETAVGLQFQKRKRGRRKSCSKYLPFILLSESGFTLGWNSLGMSFVASEEKFLTWTLVLMLSASFAVF